MLDRPARPSDTAPRLALLGLCLCLAALGGCGRRGPLEPPNAGSAGPSATTTTAPASPRALPASVGAANGGAAPDPDAVVLGDEVPVNATPPGLDTAPVKTVRGAKRGYTVPKQPFILDPIL